MHPRHQRRHTEAAKSGARGRSTITSTPSSRDTLHRPELLGWLLSGSAARSLRIWRGMRLDDRLRIRSDRVVLRVLGSRLAAAVPRLAARAMSVLRNACQPSSVAGGCHGSL
jgi:hypothetical protein